MLRPMDLENFLSYFHFDYKIVTTDTIGEREIREMLIERGDLPPEELDCGLIRLTDLENRNHGDIEMERYPVSTDSVMRIVERLDIYINDSIIQKFKNALKSYGIITENLYLEEMIEECQRQHIQSVPYRFAEMVVHPEYIYIPELDKELVRKYRQTSFVTYEHPYKGKVFSLSEMRWLYIEQVDKNEYSEFSIWVTDMLKAVYFRKCQIHTTVASTAAVSRKVQTRTCSAKAAGNYSAMYYIQNYRRVTKMLRTDWLIGVSNMDGDRVSMFRFYGTKEEVKQKLVEMADYDRKCIEEEGFDEWNRGTESVEDVEERELWELYAYGRYCDFHIDYSAIEFSHVERIAIKKYEGELQDD